MSAPPAPRASERRVAAWLAAVAALAYLPFNHCHFSASDESGVFEPARSLALRGDTAIAEGKHVYRGRDGRLYSHFAIGQSLLALPLVALGEAVAAGAPEEWVRAAIGREYRGYLDTREDPAIFFASLYAPLASGALVALFYAFERRLGASRRSALWASALLGASSYVAAHSVFFLCHTSEALAIVGSLFALYLWRTTGRLRWLALGSLAASAVVLIRVPAAISGLALAGYLAFTWIEKWRAGALRPRLAVALAAAAGPALALAAVHVAVNYAQWGSFVRSPMLAQSPLLRGSLHEGLVGLLFSPGASLFVYSPLLLLLPVTLPGFWRAQRAECVAVLALAASFLLVCGSFVFWHGLWSAPGPRYLFALTPLLMLPLGPWLDRARGLRWRLLTGALALLGLAVQLVLVLPIWRRAVELMDWTSDRPRFAFLFDPLRSTLVGCWQAIRAGEIDVYLWSLWHGVFGREPQPLLATALGLAWAVLFVLACLRLRAALASDREVERVAAR